VHTPDRVANLNSIQSDIKFLKARYGLDKEGRGEGRIVMRYALIRGT
jgi:hypothetical protein